LDGSQRWLKALLSVTYHQLGQVGDLAAIFGVFSLTPMKDYANVSRLFTCVYSNNSNAKFKLDQDKI
jgi:hypothetical protein